MSTTEDKMSSTVADADETVEQRLAALEDRVCELEAENQQLRGVVEQLTDRLNDVEQHQEETADVRWTGPNPGDMEIEPTEKGTSVKPYAAITDKADGEEFDQLVDTVDELGQDVHDLKVDGVDAADLVGTGDHEEVALPIEDTISALRSDVRDDPSANKQRATVLFRAFGGRAQPTKGGKLQLDSAGARSILQEKAGIEDVNRNTLKRSMKQTAKLTSDKPKQERRARDGENLITLVKGEDGRLVLRADRDEWREYLGEVEGRYQ